MMSPGLLKLQLLVFVNLLHCAYVLPELIRNQSPSPLCSQECRSGFLGLFANPRGDTSCGTDGCNLETCLSGCQFGADRMPCDEACQIKSGNGCLKSCNFTWMENIQHEVNVLDAKNISVVITPDVTKAEMSFNTQNFLGHTTPIISDGKYYFVIWNSGSGSAETPVEIENDKCTVELLDSNTKYNVSFLIMYDENVIFVKEVGQFKTLPSPNSNSQNSDFIPIVTLATFIRPQLYLICWILPAEGITGMVTGFEMTVHIANSGVQSHDMNMSTCYTIDSFPETKTEYRVAVRAKLASGLYSEFSPLEYFISPSATNNVDPKIIYATNNEIYRLRNSSDSFNLDDSALIFKTNIGEQIAAIAGGPEPSLFFANTRGEIFQLSKSHIFRDLTPITTTPASERISKRADKYVVRKVMSDSGIQIKHLASDQFADRIMFVESPKKIGHCIAGVNDSLEQYSCTKIVVKNLGPGIHVLGLAIDGLNGYFYYSTSDGSIFKRPLPSRRSKFALRPESENDAPQIVLSGTVTVPLISLPLLVDYWTFSLIFPHGTSLVQTSLTRNYVSNKQLSSVIEALPQRKTNVFNTRITQLASTDRRTASSTIRPLYFTAFCNSSNNSNGCLYLEEYNSALKLMSPSKIYISATSVIGVSGWEPLKMKDLLINAARNVGVTFGTTSAMVHWDPPSNTQFQAKKEWRKLIFSISIQKVDESKTLKSVQLLNYQTNYKEQHVFRDLKPSTNYQIMITVQFNEAKSEPVSLTGKTLNESLSAFNMAVATDSNLYLTDPAGLNVTKISSYNYYIKDIISINQNSYKWLFLTNSSIVYLGNAMNRFTRKPQTIPLRENETVYGIDWEPVGKMAYWISNTGLYRTTIRGTVPQFLAPISDYQVVKGFAIWSRGGLVIVATYNRIDTYSLFGTNRKTIFRPNCSKKTIICEKILAIALDSVTGNVGVITQKDVGLVTSYVININNNRISTFNNYNKTLPKLKYLQLFGNRFYFVTSDGMLGTTDIQLEEINYFDTDSFEYPVKVAKILNAPYSNETLMSPKITYVKLDNNTSVSTSMSTHLNLVLTVDKKNIDDTYFEIIVDNQTHLVSEPKIAIANPYGFKQISVSARAFNQWSNGPYLHVTKNTPATVPLPPSDIELFINIERTFESNGKTTSHLIVLWNKPTWNGTPKGFELDCKRNSSGQMLQLNYRTETANPSSMEPVPPNVFEYSMEDVSTQLPIVCRIAAENKEMGMGMFSKYAKITVQDPVKLYQFAALTNDKSNLEIIYISSDHEIIRQKLISQQTKMAHVSGLDEELYFLTEEGNNLFKSGYSNSLLDTQPPVQIDVLPSGIIAGSMTMDYVGRRIFFVAVGQQRTIPKNSQIWIYEIDSKITKKLIEIDGLVKQLKYDPLNSTLFYSKESDKKITLHLTQVEYLDDYFTGNDHEIKCEIAVSDAIFINYDIQSMEITFNFVTVDGVGRFSPSKFRCLPELIYTKGDFHSIKQFALTERNSMIALFNNNSLMNINFDFQNSTLVSQNVKCFSDVTIHRKPFPKSTCVLIPPQATEPKLNSLNGNSVEVLIIPPNNAGTKCKNILPPTKYFIQIQRADQPIDHCSSYCRINTTYKNLLRIGKLEENQEYRFALRWNNAYTADELELSTTANINTSFFETSAPRNVSAKPLTPVKIEVTWNSPTTPRAALSDLRYGIVIVEGFTSHFAPGDIGELKPNITCPSELCSAVLTAEPSSEYSIQVYVQPKNGGQSMVSRIYPVKTLDNPGKLLLVDASRTSDSVIFQWIPNVYATRISHLKLRYGYDRDWHVKKFDEFIKKSERRAKRLPTTGIYEIKLTDLVPGRPYQTKLDMTYDNGRTYEYIEPGLDYFTTKSTVPSKPIDVVVIINENGKYQIQWTKPEKSGGKRVNYYHLEYKSPDATKWTKLNQDLKDVKFVVPRSMQFTDSTLVRVSAVNSVGMGEYAFPLKQQGSTDSMDLIIIIVACSLAVLAVLIIVLVILFVMWRKGKFGKAISKQKLEDQRISYLSAGSTVQTSLDARFSMTSLATNPQDRVEFAELIRRIQVPRKCITVTKRLGKGAFGDVYEGLAYNLPSVGQKTVPVAIKTLPPGASDADTRAFMKEAQLMSQCNHKNIVKLLGICVEMSPEWIILELMEAGDLHSYLKSARPTQTMPSQVSLHDLLKISLDIASGCSYLEMNRQVHRDLATRNCLLSSRDHQQRIVKIADFGLAREMIDDDSTAYYRVHGDVKLPIRWMAPESILDGVFTIKSDVWSFGVVLWEMMTLGDHPYGVTPNRLISHLVPSGTRLDQPLQCPDQVYDVMQTCWDHDPEARPSFLSLRDTVQDLLTKIGDNEPFPNTPLEPAPTPTESRSQSGSGEANIDLDHQAAKFQRGSNASASTKSQKNKKKGNLFNSFRKPKSPPPPPPSKADLEARSGSPTKLSTLNPPNRPMSRISDTSFTTTAEGYEVPLVKGLTNSARQQQMNQDPNGHVNYAYVPSTPGSAISSSQFRNSDNNQSVGQSSRPTSVNSSRTDYSERPYRPPPPNRRPPAPPGSSVLETSFDDVPSYEEPINGEGIRLSSASHDQSKVANDPLDSNSTSGHTGNVTSVNIDEGSGGALNSAYEHDV